MKVYYLLLWVCNVSGGVIEKVRTEEGKRKTIIERLSKRLPKDRTELLDGYTLLGRRVVIDVKQFKNYGHMKLFSFHMLCDVTDARFTFFSEEIHLNNIGTCKVKDVIVNLKRLSYPAVNPDNYSFPDDFIPQELREEVHTINMQSNGIKKYYSIENPKPGKWYGLVYVKWEDPKKKKVQQKGLAPDCNTVFYTDLQVKQLQNIEVIDCYAGLWIDYADIPADFKCMTEDTIKPIYFNITVTNTTTNSKLILFRLQALSLPTEDESMISCVFDPKLENIQTITFDPWPEVWHYIQIQHLLNGLEFDNCATYYELEESDRNYTVIELMRDDKGRFFTFEYGLPTTDLRQASSIINMATKETKTVKFHVNEIVDIGGNIIIKATTLMSFEYYMGYRKEMVSDLLGLSKRSTVYKIVVCLDFGYASIPLETEVCIFNDNIKQPVFVMNNIYVPEDYHTVVIPYPDSGTWYLTFRMFYEDELVCLCRTSHDVRKYFQPEESDLRKGNNISESYNFTNRLESNQNASVVFSVQSSACIYDDCEHGECKLQSRDMVISFCSCNRGYGGWDCADDSRMDSKWLLFLAILLLTLSNIFFLITIYAAIIRVYYTEAVIYFFTMVFSTIYHACDSPDVVSECIMKEENLQFSDFFCGILCFWVTLLAVSIIPDTLRTALQLAGAIPIAILTTWDKHSLVTFMLPFIIGSVILFLSWFWDRIKNKRWKYKKVYYKIYLPIGIVLVIIGLICYAGLQTERNYYAVHSIWHGLIALSVAFVLPDVRREDDSHPFKPSPNFGRPSFLKIFKKAEEPVNTVNTNT